MPFTQHMDGRYKVELGQKRKSFVIVIEEISEMIIFWEKLRASDLFILGTAALLE